MSNSTADWCLVLGRAKTFYGPDNSLELIITASNQLERIKSSGDQPSTNMSGYQKVHLREVHRRFRGD